jgi:hypothetical protein
VPADEYVVDLVYRLEHGELFASTKRFQTIDEAREFRSTALRTQALWAPRDAVDVEVSDVRGPGIEYGRATRETNLAGFAMMKAAAAKIEGKARANGLGRHAQSNAA